MEAKFIDIVEKVIVKKNSIRLTKDEGWYSESEMRNDLNWSTYLCCVLAQHTANMKNIYNLFPRVASKAAHQRSKSLLHEIEREVDKVGPPQVATLDVAECFASIVPGRTNQYDNVVEYWVTVRERGSREQLHEQEEKKSSTSKANHAVH